MYENLLRPLFSTDDLFAAAIVRFVRGSADDDDDEKKKRETLEREPARKLSSSCCDEG